MLARATALGALLLATTTIAASCGDNGGSEQRDEVSVGVIAIVDVAPIYLGDEKGFFAERGIDLTMEVGSGGAASVPGVTSGKFEFAFGNITSLLVARDEGLPLRAVANGVSSTGKAGDDFGAVVVGKDSPIRDAGDLQGRTVSVNNLQNIGDTTIRAAVEKAGGDPSAVRFTEVPFPDAPAAVANGRVDAAWVVEPFLTLARSEGARVVAWNFVEAVPDLPVALYFTSEKVARQDPDLVKRFTAAIRESLRYSDRHPDEVRQIIDTYTEIPEKVKSDMVLPKWPARINRDAIETVGSLAKEHGLIEQPADIDGLLGSDPGN